MAAVTAAAELTIAWGPTLGPLDRVDLPEVDPARPGLVPTDVAIVANPDRILVVVTLQEGGDDEVAWTVYERP